MLGGLGFMVISDLLERRSRQLRLHTRIVLVTNTALIAFGLVMFAVNEWHNPLTLARQGAGAGEKLLNAFFQAVTTRTAGFFSFDQAAMSETSKLVSTVLMFIGASPASTGGGVKTSSFFVVIMVLIALVYGRGYPRLRPAARHHRPRQDHLFLCFAADTGRCC